MNAKQLVVVASLMMAADAAADEKLAKTTIETNPTGATVQVDASPGTGGDRWQAALPAAAAERLRSSARRLSP